jgi:hypothetical protein
MPKKLTEAEKIAAAEAVRDGQASPRLHDFVDRIREAEQERLRVAALPRWRKMNRRKIFHPH